jgi:hypothetical protein
LSKGEIIRLFDHQEEEKVLLLSTEVEGLHLKPEIEIIQTPLQTGRLSKHRSSF